MTDLSIEDQAIEDSFRVPSRQRAGTSSSARPLTRSGKEAALPAEGCTANSDRENLQPGDANASLIKRAAEAAVAAVAKASVRNLSGTDPVGSRNPSMAQLKLMALSDPALKDALCAGDPDISAGAAVAVDRVLARAHHVAQSEVGARELEPEPETAARSELERQWTAAALSDDEMIEQSFARRESPIDPAEAEALDQSFRVRGPTIEIDPAEAEMIDTSFGVFKPAPQSAEDARMIDQSIIRKPRRGW